MVAEAWHILVFAGIAADFKTRGSEDGMIEHRQDVLPLLEEYIATQYEWIRLVWIPNTERWDSQRQSLYWDGIPIGKFRERDPMTMLTLEEGVSDNALRQELFLYYERERKAIQDQKEPDILQRMRLPCLLSQLEQLSNQPIDDWIDSHLGWILKEAAEIPYVEARVLIYLFHAYYNFDAIRKGTYNADLSSLTATYDGIFNKQSQFKTYGLVPIDQDRAILPGKPPRIYDRSINKTFFTKNTPLHLLEKLSDMNSSGLINNLAVRLMNEPGYEGRLHSEFLQEVLERGEQFALANLGTFSVSRLYSDSYNDCLWVVIDPQNITFEELCEDYEFDGDMIITQVVHLEYITSEDGAFITHLDHEYIFYTFEQYDERLHNPSQKGEAKTRMKSFKIDNSRIPFDHTCENKRKDENGNDLPVQHVPFLIYVLESYFRHKDLLIEYFQKMLH